jgi:hypothetical protein
MRSFTIVSNVLIELLWESNAYDSTIATDYLTVDSVVFIYDDIKYQ